MRRSVLQELQQRTQSRDNGTLTVVPRDAAQRLRVAYEEDLPLTFTHYAPAQPLTRRPIHYTEFLSVLHTHVMQIQLQQGTHQGANEYHGRCGTILHRLPAFFLDALRLIFDETYSAANEGNDDNENSSSEENSGDAGNVGKAKKTMSGQKKANGAAQQEQKNHSLAATGGEISVSETPENEADEVNTDRSDCILPLSVEQEAARQALLEYLFHPRESNAPKTMNSDSVISAEALRQLFFGMRLIAADTSEYMETLSMLGRELQAGQQRKCDTTTQENDTTKATKESNKCDEVDEGTFTTTLACTTMEQTHTALPEYLRSLLLAGVMASTTAADEKAEHNASTTLCVTENAVESNMKEEEAMNTVVSCPAQLLRYTSHPIVKVSTDQVMDALLPPRLLEYFDMEPDLVRAEFRRREKHRRRIEQLRLECQRHKDSKHLMREMEAELAALRAQDPVIGERVVLLERASTQCPLREDMERLEDGVETALRESRARCWGSPVRGTGYKRLLLQQQQQQQARVMTTGPDTTVAPNGNEEEEEAAASAVTDKKTKPEVKQTTQKALRKGVTYPVAAPTTILSQPHSTHTTPAATTTNTTTSSVRGTNNAANAEASETRLVAPPHPNTRGGPFYQTIKPHTQPSALDETTGGSVSVTTTMNVLELNDERHVIYYNLLAQELLRQVTLDLPERGVLLAHILNEAELSIHTYDVLLSERVAATGEQLLEGQEARSAAADKLAALEREVSALRSQKASLEERQRALQHWAMHRRAEDERALVRTKNFAEMVLERLRRHAAEVQMQQDKERRDVHDG